MGRCEHSVGTVVISGSLGVVMVSTLALNARNVDSILALDIIFPILITPMTIPLASEQTEMNDCFT